MRMPAVYHSVQSDTVPTQFGGMPVMCGSDRTITAPTSELRVRLCCHLFHFTWFFRCSFYLQRCFGAWCWSEVTQAMMIAGVEDVL